MKRGGCACVTVVCVSRSQANIDLTWEPGRKGSTWSNMAKGKPRVRVRRPESSKASRGQKGHSSSSNPVTNKHRLSARGKFASHLAQAHDAVSGPSLTTEALTTHDANQEDGSALDR